MDYDRKCLVSIMIKGDIMRMVYYQCIPLKTHILIGVTLLHRFFRATDKEKPFICVRFSAFEIGREGFVHWRRNYNLVSTNKKPEKHKQTKGFVYRSREKIARFDP